MTMPTMPNAEQFLMGGVPSISFKDKPHGSRVTGTIAEPPDVQQQHDYDDGKPLYWDDGKPKLQLKVVLMTGERDPSDPADTGERALYIKGQMQQAVKAAVKAAGVRVLAVGGTLTVTYVSDGEQKDRRKNPPKVYSAAYVPPNPLDQVAPPAAAVPAQLAQPAAAPPAAQVTPPVPAAVDPAAAMIAAAQAAAAAPVAPPEIPAPPAPAGQDPAAWAAQWAQLAREQRAAVYAAMGLPLPA